MALINEKFARKVNQLENRVSDHHELLIELVREIQKLIDTPNQKIESDRSVSLSLRN
jgi:hypothetical protein